MSHSVTGNIDTQTLIVEMPYAIGKLEEASRIIRQAINELPTLRKRLEKNKDARSKARDIYGDMQNQLRRLLSGLDTAALSLLEAEQSDLANHTINLAKSIQLFNLMTPDYSKLCAALTGYLSKLPIEDTAGEIQSPELYTTNKNIIGRLMNNVRMGYYPTCTDNLAHIIRGMEIPENININLLDPCCGCGIALRSMAEGITARGVTCKTYGIELDSYRAEEALTRLDRVGFGSFYHSRISNEAFHAMLLNPPYLSVMTEGGNNTRSERRFLVDSINNLMLGGLLIYIIPYYRLNADIARILCENFSDISVWKFTSGEFKKFKQIAVMGTRQKRVNGAGLGADIVSLVLTPDSIPELTELPAGRYQLPGIAKEVTLFKGALFNERELAEQLGNSKSFSRLFQRSKLDNSSKRPLLPLSIGQIGLVGGSGMINGWVDCDTPHIIKGRIVKEKRIRTDENISARGDLVSTTLTETISNKLVFNLLTSDGFISLTDYGGNGVITDSDNDASEGTYPGLDHPISKDTDNMKNNDVSFVKTSKRLALGQTVVTRAAREVLSDYDIHNALRRHETGDWGEVTKSDWNTNDDALKYDERVLSIYQSADGVRFWIITEWDRSVTTVLMPEDY